MENLTHFVKLKVIWEDPDIICAEVTASNKRYSGIAEGYINLSDFPEFIEQLKGFPKDSGAHSIIYETVEVHSSFSIALQLVSGRVLVIVDMFDDKFNFKNKLYMEMYAEPAAIDTFQKQLVSILKNRAGEALLIGFE